MTSKKRSILRVGLLVIILILIIGTALFRNHNASQELTTTPKDVGDFRSLEVRVQAATNKVSSAVVAVQSPVEESKSPVFASGVIISADGLVLSQFHVSHRLSFHGNPGEEERSIAPGTQTTVILSDGRATTAELLGAHQTHDLSLLKLHDAGPHHFVPLEPKNDSRIGDWVVKLGHPRGVNRDRGTVVRLGRIISKQGDLLVTDCHLTGGDSGGPFFDLDGRLIGMVGNSEVPKEFKNLRIHLPNLLFNCDSSSFIQSFIPSMLRSEMTIADRNIRVERIQGLLQSKNHLPVEHWTQGEATTIAIRGIAQEASTHVVEVLDEKDRTVAYGSIVGANGVILSVASLIPNNPRCRLPSQQVVKAEVIGINQDFDLILMKVEASNLRPLEWAAGSSVLKVGTMLTAPTAVSSNECLPSTIGIVSVKTRSVSGPFPTHRGHAKIDATVPNMTWPSPYGQLPNFFEHDMPLPPNHCGGPVMDLNGRVVGITMFRGIYGCLAIPADSIEYLLPELRKQVHTCDERFLTE